MATKCYWCGTINEKSADTCCNCKRKLQWSTFLQALMKTSRQIQTDRNYVDERLAVKTSVGVL